MMNFSSWKRRIMQQQHSLSQFPRQAHMDVSNLSNEDLPSAYSFSKLQLILRLNKCFPMCPVIPSISNIHTLFLILQRYIQREMYILVQLKKSTSMCKSTCVSHSPSYWSQMPKFWTVFLDFYILNRFVSWRCTHLFLIRSFGWLRTRRLLNNRALCENDWKTL